MTKVSFDNDERLRHNAAMGKQAASLVAAILAPVFAQTPAFEVVSVKPYVVGSRRGANVGCSNERFLS